MADTTQDSATMEAAGWRVEALLSGSMLASFGLLQGIDEGDAKALLKGAGRPEEPRIYIHAYLLTGHGRTLLVDGGLPAAAGGQLGAELDRRGVAPAKVDTILLTHAHSDHVGGLMTETGQAVFPEATVICAEDELAFWSSDARRAAMPEPRRASFDGARKFFDTYRTQVKTVGGGGVLPEIELVPLPGHTPGHSGFRIGSGRDGILIWADIVHFPVIQLARPEVTVGFDVEPAVAAATRDRLLPELVASGTRIGGMHLEPPGFIRLAESGDGYGIQPA